MSVKVEKTKVVTDEKQSYPKPGQTVVVQYTGKLANGKVFDSSKGRPKPFKFVLGAGTVIKAWDQGIAQLRVGEEATLTCPPELAYGATGYPGVIPPNATLTFDVVLEAIE